MKRKKPKPDADSVMLQLVSEAEKLSIQAIRLVELHSKLGDLQKELPTHAAHTIGINANVGKAEPQLEAVVQTKLTLGYDAAEGSAPAVEIVAVHVLTYLLKSPIAGKHLEQIMNNVASNNIWPFWRELVHSTTARMGLPPFPLPLLKPRDMATNSNSAKEIG